MNSLRFSASAENDLLEAWLYVAENNIDAADRMLNQIKVEASGLLMQPAMGRTRNELAPGLRSWPTTTPYLLFYFMDDSGVVVARVLHHARDILAIEVWPKHTPGA